MRYASMLLRQAVGSAVLFALIYLTAFVALAVFPFLVAFWPSRMRRLVRSFDQLGNVLLAGDEDEFLSSRIYRNRGKEGWSVAYRWVDAFFLWYAGEYGHCENSYRKELNKRRVYLADTSSQ